MQAEAQAKYLKTVKGVAANKNARQRYQSLWADFQGLDDTTYFNYELEAVGIPGVSGFGLWLSDQRKRKQSENRVLSPDDLEAVLAAAEAE